MHKILNSRFILTDNIQNVSKLISLEDCVQTTGFVKYAQHSRENIIKTVDNSKTCNNAQRKEEWETEQRKKMRKENFLGMI